MQPALDCAIAELVAQLRKQQPHQRSSSTQIKTFVEAEVRVATVASKVSWTAEALHTGKSRQVFESRQTDRKTPVIGPRTSTATATVNLSAATTRLSNSATRFIDATAGLTDSTTRLATATARFTNATAWLRTTAADVASAGAIAHVAAKRTQLQRRLHPRLIRRRNIADHRRATHATSNLLRLRLLGDNLPSCRLGSF